MDYGQQFSLHESSDWQELKKKGKIKEQHGTDAGLW